MELMELVGKSPPLIVLFIGIIFLIYKIVDMIIIVTKNRKNGNSSYNSTITTNSLCYTNNTEIKILKEKLVNQQAQINNLESAIYQLIDKNSEEHRKIVTIIEQLDKSVETSIDILNKIV